MFITNCTRPDLACTVNKLSRFTSNPSKALRSVLRYLKYTLNFELQYTNYPQVLEGYCDANWISDSKDLFSTSVKGLAAEAYINRLHNNPDPFSRLFR